jgi:hypothetical protein
MFKILGATPSAWAPVPTIRTRIPIAHGDQEFWR